MNRATARPTATARRLTVPHHDAGQRSDDRWGDQYGDTFGTPQPDAVLTVSGLR